MKAQSWRTSLLTPLTTIEPGYRRARRLSGQPLFKLPALVDGQVVHLRKPHPKDAMFHHKLHQYATNSTMGSRTDLMRIEPSRRCRSHAGCGTRFIPAGCCAPAAPARQYSVHPATIHSILAGWTERHVQAAE